MSHGAYNACSCGDPAEIFADLFEADLLEMQPGERLWKLYCFRDLHHPNGLRHRIYTKEKADSRLALLTFAVHNPPREEADMDEPPPARSALARVPDLSSADLDQLIRAMRAQTGSEACEELDLSGRSLDDQRDWLRSQTNA